jgi:hypothetical protein
MVGYGRLQSPVRLRLAVARRNREGIRAIIDSLQPEWLTPSAWELWAALFDGLVEIDDRRRIETDAPPWVRPDTYVAPFAVRALGIAREDKTLLADAVARFEAMGLNRHAEATREALAPSR